MALKFRSVVWISFLTLLNMEKTIEDIRFGANNLLNSISCLKALEKEIKPLREIRETLEECLEPLEKLLLSFGFVRDGLTGEEFIRE